MSLPIAARELLATAHRWFVEKTPVDVFYSKNDTWRKIWKNKKKYPGGRNITFPVQINKLTSVIQYTGNDVVTPGAFNQVLIDGNTTIRHWAVPIEIADTDLMAVDGPAKVVDLMEAYRNATISEGGDFMGVQLFNGNPFTAPLDWNSLRFLIGDNVTDDALSGGSPTLILGIDSTANTKWRSQVIDAATFAGGPGITKDMCRRLINNVAANTTSSINTQDYIFILRQTDYETLERQIDPQVRYASKDTVEALVPKFEAYGVTFTWDPHLTTNDAYLVNMKDLRLLYHPMTAMIVDPFESLRNDATLPRFVNRAWLRLSGQFIVTRRPSHGRIKDLA